jgi:chaperone required for assembly of F1-ATPase
MLHRTVTLGGSLVLGLAFLKGRMDANALFEAAFLDELWQAEKWGSDWEAEDRRTGIKSELADAERFLYLVRVSR